MIQFICISGVLAVAAWIDLKTQRIPNVILLITLVTGLFIQVLFTFLGLVDRLYLIQYFQNWCQVFIQLIFMTFILLCLFFFSRFAKDGFGMGDVKMATLLVLFSSPITWFVILLFACFIAIFSILFRKFMTKSNSGTSLKGIAFGPPMWLAYTLITPIYLFNMVQISF